jgi:hypothetical protein
MKKSFIATALVVLLNLVGVGAGQSNAGGYTFTDIGTLGGSYSFAFGMKNSGQVVGDSLITGDFAIHATI